MRATLRELIDRYLPRVRQSRGDLEGNWSGFCTGKAEAVLNFKALHLLGDRTP